MRTIEHVLPIKSNQMVRVLRYLLDSVLACAGSLLVTAVIVVFHLYPAISNISIVYLLVVLALAITRGRYAAILTAVVAFLSLAYFIVPPLHTFRIYLVEEWIALFGLLIATMLTGHLAVALRERAEQATRRESETRQLSEVVRATSQEAEAAHARLYDFFMQAPAAMTILRGPEHRIEFANPLALRHRDQADLMGKTAREVRPELVEQGVLAILDEVYTTGTPFVGTEFPVRVDRRGDGVLEEAYYNFVYQPLRTAQGDIEGILVHSVEVTEQVLARRRVEELNRQLEAEKNALRQTEQEAQARTAELEAIFEAMTEGVIVCDARGEVRYINAAYRSLLALEEDADPSLLQLDHRIEWLAFRDLEGRPLPKEQLPVLRVLQGECLSSTHRMDCMCRTRKGEDLILNVSGAPIRDAAGQIAGGVVVFRDVTGQRHIEQQLQYSERKLLSLVDSNIFGVVVVDIDGRFYEANERFVQMVGYSKEELLSGAVTWQQLNLPEYQEATAQAVGAVLSTGAMYPYEKEHLHRDGSRAPILIAGAMIDQKRELVLVVILDISERKAAERRKQEFLSMVSHELRTPLTSIMGFIDLALVCSDLLPRPLSPEAEKLMDKMETGLKRAMRQVEVEARIVEETVANQQQAARTRQIELVFPPDELVPVIADAGRVGQALTNYLINALKYAPLDQVISVRLEVEASIARVPVRDQGPGLTPEQQQRVWERFYQVAAPGLQGPDGGLGLGLAIARTIIEQHQGQVGVESAPGRGSTFWFTLPIEVSPEG